ncbi:MAG TPA: hypothetical protein VMD77_11695 [Candidatus Baltobacteraceae bacterium]|nr:hypothetical protein [Candidatus Baltobacteraceae bacterium]
MNKRRPFPQLIVLVALLSLLLVGMTLVSVCHHHSDSAEITCSICHLSHQPIDRPLAIGQAPTMALVAPAPEPADTGIASAPVIRRLPARAPPSA